MDGKSSTGFTTRTQPSASLTQVALAHTSHTRILLAMLAHTDKQTCMQFYMHCILKVNMLKAHMEHTVRCKVHLCVSMPYQHNECHSVRKDACVYVGVCMGVCVCVCKETKSGTESDKPGLRAPFEERKYGGRPQPLRLDAHPTTTETAAAAATTSQR